jgi:hypothetical protein
MYLHSFIYSNLREVPARRCSGFLGIAGLKELANMERQHPEPISLEPDVTSQHHWLIIR